MNRYDAIIIGAGPAGLTAARTLGLAGANTLLLEQKPTIGPKICAGGITLKCHDLGIPRDLEGIAFRSVTLHSPQGRTAVVRSDEPFVRTVSRETLGAWMAGQLKDLPVTIRTGTTVNHVRGNSVVLNDGEEIRGTSIIGADGTLSVVRRACGIPTRKVMTAMHYRVPQQYEALEFFADSRLFGAGYAWIFPHRHFTSIGCGGLACPWRQGTLKEAFDVWLRQRRIDVGVAKLEAWNINFDYRGHALGSRYLVGDAGGFASGLTGEGMYYAMVSGDEIAKKILNPAYTMPRLAALLRTKRHHERLLSMLALNRRVCAALFELGTMLLGRRRFARRALASFA